MKKFIKAMFALLFLTVGVIGVQAEKVYADLSKYADNWDGTTVSFSWTATYGNQLQPALDLPSGDLRGWEKLVVVTNELTNADFYRILVYNGEDSNHSNTFKVTATGTMEFTLSGNVDYLDNVTRIVLSGSNWEDSQNSTWGTTPASFKVSQVYLERPDDPLAMPKDNLSKTITLAKMQNSFAKTEESFAALTQAIADGEAALVDAAATAESLAASATAIENAIKALALKKGFTSLTTDFFQHWDAVANPTTGTAIEGCAYQLFVGSGLPYGDGNVGYLNFAKLTEYEKLYVTFASGTPRIMMNRDVDQGQWNADETQSHLIEYPKTGWVEKYFTNEDGVVTVDLAQIVADKGYANLNAIKGANWQDVTVTGMYLYKPVVPVAGPTFDFENNNGNWTIGEGADYAAGELTEENPITMDGITLTGVKGEATNAVRYFTNASKGNCLWIFKNNSIKLTAPEGKSITKIEFTMQTGSFDLTPSKGAVVDNVWTGKAVEVTFGPNAKGTRYVYAINVTVEDGVPATYTLAGAFKAGAGEEEASFFGEKWNPALDENLMEEQADGTYAISYDDVVFDQPGTIYFKVCENKSWDVSYGAYGQNAEKTVPVAGVYDITFTFNPAEGSVFCTLELDEIATGISNVNANAKKGQLYNLNGQQVMKAQKGLYILNGKKVILK